MHRAPKARRCVCSCGHMQLQSSTCICVGGNCVVLGFATEGCLEIHRGLLSFCKCLVLWGIWVFLLLLLPNA